MSQSLVRILVGACGGICVAGLLYLWLRSRRQKKAVGAEETSQTAPSGRPARQPGWLQSILVSVVASVLSGILLSYIPQILAPKPSPAIESPNTTAQVVTIDDSDIASEGPSNTEVLPLPEDTSSEEIEDPVPEPDDKPVVPELPDEDAEEEPEIMVPALDLDVLISDSTAEWITELDAPIAFVAVVPSADRLLIAGASATTVIGLSSATAIEVSEIPAPRIQIDSASTSEVLPLTAPLASDLAMKPRLLIEGAGIVMVVRLTEPESIENLITQSRLLIEGAAITELIELRKPDMNHGDT